MSVFSAQTALLHNFFSGERFAQNVSAISSSRPYVLRMAGNMPWVYTRAEIESVLHEFFPHLSASVQNGNIVIY